MNKSSTRRAAQYIAITILAVFLSLPLYVSTVIWRLSLYEQANFGWSCLIPLSMHSPKYKELATLDSFGAGTYSYSRNGRIIHMHKQLINGFQHAFGSAIAAFELGELPADLLFRANEYMEAIFLKNAGTEKFALDTRKDLANNAVGRGIAQTAQMRGLKGKEAEEFLATETLQAMDDGTVLNHYDNPAVEALPTPEQYGCLYLPNKRTFLNIF